MLALADSDSDGRISLKELQTLAHVLQEVEALKKELLTVGERPPPALP